MPWFPEAKKDAASCDMPGGTAEQVAIPGFPNGETRRDYIPSLRRKPESHTWRSETSQ